jgi:hypothetical protein
MGALKNVATCIKYRGSTSESPRGLTSVETIMLCQKPSLALPIVQQTSSMQLPTFSILSFALSAAAFPTLIKSRQDAVTSNLHKQTDYYLFNITNEAFLAARAAMKEAALGIDWSADGCSSSPDDPFGFDCTLSANFVSCSDNTLTFLEQ